MEKGLYLNIPRDKNLKYTYKSTSASPAEKHKDALGLARELHTHSSPEFVSAMERVLRLRLNTEILALKEVLLALAFFLVLLPGERSW